VRVWADGSRYEGEWADDAAHGFGVFVGAGPRGVRYEGEWVCGRREGAGVESYGHTQGLRFVCPLGYVHSGGARCIYDGSWACGLYAGEGTFTCGDGRQYHGDWAAGKRTGFGRWVMVPRALQYAAVRGVDGALELQGLLPAAPKGGPLRLDDAYRVKVYEGEMYKNKRRGVGKTTLVNGDVLEGEFHFGRPQGVMRTAFSSGRTSFALYEFGKRVGWINGEALRALEDKWIDELRAARAADTAAERGMKAAVKVNAFRLKEKTRAVAAGAALAHKVVEEKAAEEDRKSTRLNSSHTSVQARSRMPSSA
jgi:hypothetical protein